MTRERAGSGSGEARRHRWLTALDARWRSLIEPRPEVQGNEERRRARLLAGLLLAIIPVAVFASVVIPLLTVPALNPIEDPVLLAGLAAAAVGVALWHLSRTKHSGAAARASVFTAALCTWTILALSGGTPHAEPAPYFLGVSVLFSSILLPLRYTLGLSLGNALGLLILPTFSETFTFYGVSNPLIFLLIQSSFTTVAAYVRRQDQLRIQSQSTRLVESEERYRGLFDATFEGVLVVHGGRILGANRAARELFSPGTTLLDAEALAQHVPGEALSAMLTSDGPGGRVEATLQGQDGATRCLELVAKPYRFEGHDARLIAVHDITDRKRAEADRRIAYERAQEIDRLKELDELKTRLLNTASHELNTPLTALKLQLQVLQAGPGEPIPPERRQRALDVLERNIDRLIDLVRDMLDVARLQGDRLALRLEPIDLCALVRETMESFQPLSDRTGVAIEHRIDDELWARGDAARISQVLYNLLSNAFKFTPRGGRIVIDASSRDGRVQLRVHDTGLGIDAKDQPRLFQPFSQVHDPMETTEPSTGLGLYICRGIIEGHGGRIWCESPGRGQGATFGFELATP